ncbi:MAG: cobyric acid synthase [Candidatus Omnitrophica bacterium]|nr:cobyric acid synthase [Candidatus Omnitrophota bacterium]
MSAKSLMIQGTSSHAGKSILTTAFCRIFASRGYRTAPFKSQNMSLNSFVTALGEEVAVAQAVQAEAAGTALEVEMNPILLKPIEHRKSQVVLMGRPVETMDVYGYDSYKSLAWDTVRKAYESLAGRFDVIVIEGAGSPVEMNLKARDIANMKVAEMADAPVILVTDIDRGGIMASLVGTMELLEPEERKRVMGFVINKFRGERRLLDSAVDFIEHRTGKPVLGVIPYLEELGILSEDSVSLEDVRPQGQKGEGKGKVRIAAIRLPHISNFTDFAPLEMEKEVSFEFVRRPDELNGRELIIIPGSKNTISDMNFLRKSGFVEKIIEMKSSGTRILGICGGYQMLGREVRDPDHVESEEESIQGLGLLDAVTVMEKEKRTIRVKARPLADTAFFKKEEVYTGFEIHMGQTTSKNSPLFRLEESNQLDGSVSEEGLVMGTYLHGLFDNDAVRSRIIQFFSQSTTTSTPSAFSFQEIKAQQYDRLARAVSQNLDIPAILNKMGL